MVNDGARVIVFGGVDAANKTHGETWGRDATHWTLLAPAGGSSPAARALHAMAYDSDRKKVVLFAGQESTGAGDTDTWEWNGTSWAKITPSDPTADGSPPMRVFHAMVYDSKRHRVVLFGGLNTNDFMSDTWEYDFGPSARPAQVARFVFAAAEAETGATVQSVTANWSTGGQGDLGGVSTPGAKAWYFDKGTFVPDKSNSANVGTSAPLQWTSSDPAQLARIFNGQGKEIAVAVTPVGANAADSAKVAVDYVELVVQYRRP
jgi:hypothetical protein